MVKENFRLNFYFNNPYKDFDRRLVRGKMFMLFRPKDRTH